MNNKEQYFIKCQYMTIIINVNIRVPICNHSEIQTTLKGERGHVPEILVPLCILQVYNSVATVQTLINVFGVCFSEMTLCVPDL